jgi:hypothetical protein
MTSPTTLHSHRCGLPTLPQKARPVQTPHLMASWRPCAAAMPRRLAASSMAAASARQASSA